MAITHNLGFPRIGKNRELKFALEDYWKGKSTKEALYATAKQLRSKHWGFQKNCDWVPVGDFSLYDQVLDMSLLLGNLPSRVGDDDELNQYFRAARGQANVHDLRHSTYAGEMTKWFNTNYHYIVPELTKDNTFTLNASHLIDQIREAKLNGVNVKPVFIGPLTYLWLSKTKDDSLPLDYLEKILPVYRQLLLLLKKHNIAWVQIDEPILVTELSQEWKVAFEKTYHKLHCDRPNILLTTYFGPLKDNLQFACKLPVDGLHIDAVDGHEDVKKVVDWLPVHKVLSLGVINGRNIWKSDLNAILKWLSPIADRLGDRLWLAPSCSLLHVPVDLDSETEFDSEISNWLAFANQKLVELDTLKIALNGGAESVKPLLLENAEAINARSRSKRVHKPDIKHAVKNIHSSLGERKNHYRKRKDTQNAVLSLPTFPTTTIGSFPQTQEIRSIRLKYKKSEVSYDEYIKKMQAEIAKSVEEQEKLGLDVLVHGEAERNDMVEYFGEQLDGYVFSRFGWVQSYGSRCVKPPIIYGDIARPNAITVNWITYAQSLTDKPLKGMLTGPVTMLNWSFVRDDQPRRDTCLQLALAIREEVLDLERAGIKIIQVDEAALREGLPVHKTQWPHYLDWAVESFRICANGVHDKTQIHTHMCYSEFNDIIDSISSMDADVITIETSRSDMELLDVFNHFEYPNEIGPGVYDIHSPNVPEVSQVVKLMNAALKRIPKEQLWINPDCGLKTRQWSEVRPALKNMVLAAHSLRAGNDG